MTDITAAEALDAWRPIDLMTSGKPSQTARFPTMPDQRSTISVDAAVDETSIRGAGFGSTEAPPSCPAGAVEFSVWVWRKTTRAGSSGAAALFGTARFSQTRRTASGSSPIAFISPGSSACAGATIKVWPVISPGRANVNVNGIRSCAATAKRTASVAAADNDSRSGFGTTSLGLAAVVYGKPPAVVSMRSGVRPSRAIAGNLISVLDSSRNRLASLSTGPAVSHATSD